MPLTQAQQRNIQGVSLAGFRKDQQHLLFVTFPDAASGQALLKALAPRVASHLEVAAFNRAFSEILDRTERGGQLRTATDRACTGARSGR